MNIPAYANPGLSELMAPGNQRAANIQQDLGQTQQSLGQIPGIVDRSVASQARDAESQRNARPVTPWEKAAARLLAGHDPKAVAADTKAALAGSPGGISNLMPQATSPIASGAAPQMPQQMQPQMPQRTSPMGGVMSVGPTYNGDMSGMQRPQMQQPAPQPQQGVSNVQGPEDVFQGMNHRDWGDYITALEKGKLANQHPERDYLAEIALRNQGNQSVAETGAGAKKDVANITTEGKIKTAHERIDEKRQEMIMHHKDYQDYLQVLRDKNSAWERVSGGKASSDPALQALVKKAQSASTQFGKVASASILDLTPEGKAAAETLKEESAQNWAAVEAYLATHPQAHNSFQGSISSGTKSGTPAATKPQYKPGDKVTYNGQVRVIKTIDDKGNVTFQ